MKADVQLIPIAQITLDSASTSGALRIFFKDDKDSYVGDSISLTFTDGKFDGRDDKDWRKHTLARLSKDGKVSLSYTPVRTKLLSDGIDEKKIAPKARVY